MTDSKITNILIVGIGGQGVMTASEILAQAAIHEGYDAKKTEVAGMAQRGGVVSSHVRFGEKVFSPQITPGDADILVGFEAAESLRWMPYLRPGGQAMVNTLEIEPPIVSAGVFDYPENPITDIQKADAEVHCFDAGAIARELGTFRLVNTIMLGAISEYLPFPADVLEEEVISRFRIRKPKLVDSNIQAFAAGREASAANVS